MVQLGGAADMILLNKSVENTGIINPAVAAARAIKKYRHYSP